MNPFEFYQPATIAEAMEVVANYSAPQYVAGATNLLDLMKYRVMLPDTLVDINKLEAYKKIEANADGSLQLGALVTNAGTAYHPMVEEKYPLLSKAILAGASAQIRNMATNGGNLLQKTRCYYFYDPNTPCNKRQPGTGCSAIEGYTRMMAVMGTSEDCIAVFPSDMCVALAALEAIVQVTGPTGQREIPFQEFHRLPGNTPHIDNNLLPGEIITGIRLPVNDFSKYYAYLKLRDRNSYAFALVSVATAFAMDGNIIKAARIALGGIAHKPWRVIAAEEFLSGKMPTRENFQHAAEMIMAGAKGYPDNHFKIELAKRAIVRNCFTALAPDTQLPGAGPTA